MLDQFDGDVEATVKAVASDAELLKLEEERPRRAIDIDGDTEPARRLQKAILQTNYK